MDGVLVRRVISQVNASPTSRSMKRMNKNPYVVALSSVSSCYHELR